MRPQPKVGDHIRVSMHGGKIVDAVDRTDGLHYQIDGDGLVSHCRETALIREWQVVKD
jgi:hypothetical protein